MKGVIQARNRFNVKYANSELLVSNECRLIKNVSKNRPKNEVCEICGKGFLLRYQLKEHLNTHADVKTHPCQLCGKVLKNCNSHRRHMIRSHGVGFTCEICGGNDF